MRGMRGLWLGLSLVWCASACWVPSETGEQMQRDLRALQAQQSADAKGLAEQKARLDEQMQRADRKIEEVARALEDLNRAARSTDADFGVQLDRIIKELQELRGALELTDYRLGKIEGRLDGEGSLSARLETLEKQVKAPAPAAPPAAAAAVAQPPKGKKELLAYAADLVKGGKAADARGVLRDVIKQWPTEAGIADEAHFRIGETYYDEKKCRDALPEYIKVVEKFVTGGLADRAYYKIGLCSLDVGNLEDAKIFFGEVVHTFKKSPLAKLSAQKLEEVEQRLEKEAAAKKKGKDKDAKGAKSK